MGSIKNGCKILFNILLFVMYGVFAVTLVNFCYGLVLTKMGKLVPGPGDIIHVKMAVVTLVTLLVISIIARKYLYCSLTKCKKSVTQKSTTVSGNISEVKKQAGEVKKQVVEKAQDVKQQANEVQEDIKIYIDKEIK